MSKIKDLWIDGYLNPEYINPNYRGLVGWPCQDHSVYDANKSEWSDNYLLGISGNDFFLLDHRNKNNLIAVRIKAFTPEHIPEDELSWCKFITKNDADTGWILISKKEFDSMLLYWGDRIKEPWFVPYLIASTPEEAERRKKWNL